MRSFCTTGLILCVSVGWAGNTAQAQSGSYGAPTLLPLPSVAPANPTAASYTDDSSSDPLPTPSYFTNSQEPLPEPGLRSQAATPGSNNPLADNVNSAWDNAGGCASVGGNSCCGSPCCGGGGWFGSIGGLVMSRNRANPFWTTYQTNNNVNQLMNTQNAEAGWAGGGQVTVGYGSCACGTGIAFTYWGLGPMLGNSSITDPNNNLSTPINLQTQTGNVMIGSNPASFFFDNSSTQFIHRDDRFTNLELNVLQGGVINTGRFAVTALAGFRYFRFDERLTYGAVAFGHSLGDNGGADQAYLGFRETNNLFGVQVGANMNYMLTSRLGIFVLPKAGIFANQMNGLAQLYSGDGQQGFNIASRKTDAAFLGEIDTGLNWAFTPNLRAYFGYRVIGVANVALADNQFLPFLADQQGFGQIKQNGGLILYGAFAGLAWTF